MADSTVQYSYDASGNPVVGSVNGVPLQILRQPVQQIVVPGDTATFSVVVADTRGVTFQWKFNGTDIPGATGDSLVLNNASAANEGQYSVVVMSASGSVTSASVELMLDNDNDGLPDSWEIAHFGNTTSQRSEGDPDGDGVSNLDEFLDGTNPTSNTSLRPRLTAYSEAGGSVTVEPMKLSYDLGETVTLTATPFASGVFVGWVGDVNSTSNPATLTMDGNKTVQARFASAVPIPPGAVALWRGETDASDLIGGHDGTFFAGMSVATPSVTTSGKVGGAFNFNGTVYVRVPDSAALKPAQITVEAWVFPTMQTGNEQSVIACGNSTNPFDTWWLGVLNGGRPRFRSRHSAGATTPLDAPFAIPLNQWTHLAATFDGMTRRLYVNGVQAALGSVGTLVYDPAAVPVTIGADWALNAPTAFFNGRVDEVSLYSRALTVDEIVDIYHADVVGKNVTQPYFTSSSQLPNVALGASYTQQLTTILGRGPISFSLAAGMLPPGMALSSAGVVSGVPGAPGIFDFTVRATDAAGNFTEQLCVLRVLRPVALPADLVAWWRAEPVSGNVVPDIIGGHDGGFFSGNTAVAPAYTADGKVGSAFVFDGTRYIQVRDAVELRPNEMTVEAWVFPTVQTGDEQSVIGRGSSTNDDDTWLLGVFNGKPRFWSKHLGSTMTVLEAPSTIPLNQWTHLAASFDGTTRRLYVDGVQAALESGLGPLVYDPAAVPVTIGADWARNAPTAFFNGRVDEVSLYRRALSSDEVFSLADAGSAGKSAVGPYITSPSGLPFAIVGQAYAHTFTFVRGTAPVIYGLSSDSSLPANLTLTSSGVLSGVTTKTGSFAFGVRATDAAGMSTEQPCLLQIFDRVSAPAGLVGWWRAEGNARDSVGTNHGTLRNGAGFAAGKVGQAFSLDGTDDCIEIPDSPALRPVSLTLEAWVAFDDVVGVSVIFSKPLGAGSSDSYALWLFEGQSLKSLNGVISDAASTGPILSAPFSPAPGHWYHVAYTFDDSTHQQALYVDGILAGPIGVVTKSINYDTQPLLLGRGFSQLLGRGFLRGRIDEASIYNRALTGLEIASIYDAGPAGKRL